MLRRHMLTLAGAAVLLTPLAATAEAPIKIGFPIPLSGPTALYGDPVLTCAELAVSEINAKGGVLGRQLQLLPRDSKANADEAVRLARELIIKDNVDFLVGTLTSAEAPAVEFWGVMVKEAAYPFLVMKNPKPLPTKAQLIAALGENPFAVAGNPN